MGADCGAFAVFGTRFSKEELVFQRKLPGCAHNHSSKFCPECGKPASKTETESVDLDEMVEEFNHTHNTDLGVWRGTESEYYYVGVGTGDDTNSNGGPYDQFTDRTDYDSSQISDFVDEFIERVQKLKGETKEWRWKHSIGLWAVLYCSC